MNIFARWLMILIGAASTILMAIGVGGPISAAETERTGSYLSAAIGDDKLAGFRTFSAINPKQPSATQLTVQFAGSASSFETWSAPLPVTQPIDLSQVGELANSTRMKVRLNLAASADESPSLEGFEVTYATPLEVATDVAVKTDPAPVIATPPAAAVGALQTSTLQAQQTTVSLTQLKTTPAPKNLATSGGNLYFNLGIALVLSLLVTWLLLFSPRWRNMNDGTI